MFLVSKPISHHFDIICIPSRSIFLHHLFAARSSPVSLYPYLFITLFLDLSFPLFSCHSYSGPDLDCFLGNVFVFLEQFQSALENGASLFFLWFVVIVLPVQYCFAAIGLLLMSRWVPGLFLSFTPLFSLFPFLQKDKESRKKLTCSQTQKFLRCYQLFFYNLIIFCLQLFLCTSFFPESPGLPVCSLCVPIAVLCVDKWYCVYLFGVHSHLQD